MHTFAITGGSGYIGKHLVAELARSASCNIKLLSRFDVKSPMPRCDVIKGDLREPDSLRRFLDPECTVINLAYSRDVPAIENQRMLDNLLSVSRAVGIKRFIHCSTAVVVGTASGDQILEDAECHPTTEYAIVKYNMEKAVAAAAAGRFDSAVLRPTAVFGPDSANLKKLAEDLSCGKTLRNYIKSCLFNKRRMNLVHVDNVVAAILYIATSVDTLNGEIYTVSDSDAESNNFRDVERILMREFGMPDYSFPRLAMPSWVLGLILISLGQESHNPRADYSNRKLMSKGFQRPRAFEDGLLDYARWHCSGKLAQSVA